MPSTPLSLAAVPTSLKPIGHYLKTANEHETRDPIITYWCRLSALQNGLKLDKKSKEALAVLLPLMDWLEKVSRLLCKFLGKCLFKKYVSHLRIGTTKIY